MAFPSFLDSLANDLTGSNLTAHELQTEYTRYSTVFNSRAVQSFELGVSAWRLTFPKLVLPPSQASNFRADK
jgi:hypothetical protein